MRTHTKTAVLCALAAAAAFWCASNAAAQNPPQDQISFEGLENLAFEKPTWINGGAGQGHAGLLTDGETASDPYLGGPTRVGVDFEEVVKINGIHIWHYWADGRTYTGNIIALSEALDFGDLADGDKDRLDDIAGIVTIFNTDADDETYAESAAGYKLVFEAVDAQYLHAWLGGSDANQWSHWVEIQAYFNPDLLSVDPEGKAAAVWGELKTR